MKSSIGEPSNADATDHIRLFNLGGSVRVVLNKAVKATRWKRITSGLTGHRAFQSQKRI
jgi:hypothetical protein